MKKHIFREYDIRGVIGKDLNIEDAYQLGRGLGAFYTSRGETRITLGRDCRLTSPSLHYQLSKGLLASGIDIIDLGICPTPLVYFSLQHCGVSAGVMITGSHNAGDYNGVKVCSRGTTLFGKELQEVRAIIEEGLFVSGQGEVEACDVITPYHEYCLKHIRIKKRLTVVVDAGNGTGGVIAVPILRAMGHQVIELFCDMDGRFPNHHPDPTVEENLLDLSRAVQAPGVDIGLAFDGDSDRLGAVILDQGKPRVLWGDELMLLFSRQILAAHPGACIIGEVKCSQNLYDDIKERGGRPIMWKAGHSLIKSKMKQEHALLAGEMSGHLFFADRYFGFDDAIYAGLRLLEIVADLDALGSSVAKELSTLPKVFATPEIRYDCDEEKKFGLVEGAKRWLSARHEVNDTDGVRVRFADGWGLIRASNTQPVLVLRAEAQSEARRDEILTYLKSTLAIADADADTGDGLA
jgi:phosphomannomutase / phosphoglucomutase